MTQAIHLVFLTEELKYMLTHMSCRHMTVGYRGSNPYDAGMFYCPYVPLQMVRAVGENTFQPKIGFKTRYGMVSNPFVGSTPANGSASDLMATNTTEKWFF